MNKTRRKSLVEIASKLEDIKAEIEALRDEEQDYYDNMPENLQGSERGEIAESAVYAMECAMDGIENAIDNLEEAQT